MNVGALLGKVALGAAGGMLDNRADEIQRGEKSAEEARKQKILDQRELMKQRAAERLAQTKHQYRLGEEVIKQGGQSDLEVLKQKGAMEKAKFEGSNRIEVANINKKDAGMVDKTEKAVRQAQDSLRTEYQKAVNADGGLGEVPDFDTWAKEAFPEKYDFAFGKTEKKSKVSGFDFQGIASRVKMGANQGKPQESAAMPSNLQLPGVGTPTVRQ